MGRRVCEARTQKHVLAVASYAKEETCCILRWWFEVEQDLKYAFEPRGEAFKHR
jgi:hypothetical protein